MDWNRYERSSINTQIVSGMVVNQNFWEYDIDDDEVDARLDRGR